MAYEQRPRHSPSQPDNLTDSTKRNLNPWQDKSTNNYISGYHGNATYQEPPVSPQLDPMLQEADDGWSEWPDWGVENSEECMSNGFSNGFNGQSYSQQQQHPITTSQPQPQNFGHFFDQFATQNQQPITQPKVESAPLNSFFDNAQVNNLTASTPGNTAHLFPQESMAAESATVRTGVSYAAVLSGNAEAPEQNNGEFDDISLNDNGETDFNEEVASTQPEPVFPAASFSPFPTPMSAAHLFSKPTVSDTSHNDLFGSAAEPSLENDNDFGDEITSFVTEQQQRVNVGPSYVEESFGYHHPTPATEEQGQLKMPSMESEEPIDNTFEVHRTPSEKIAHENIEDSFASNQPFSYPTQKKNQPEMLLPKTEEATDNAFEVNSKSLNQIVSPNIEDSFTSNQPFSYPTQEQRGPKMPLQKPEDTNDNAFGVPSKPSNEIAFPNIEDSFTSNQPFSYPTQEQREPEMPLQKTEEAKDNAFEGKTQKPNENVSQNCEDSFASNQPISFPPQEQKLTEWPLGQSGETTDNTFGVHKVPSEESSHSNMEDSFASHQPFPFPGQEQIQPQTAVQESEEVANVHEDLQPGRLQEGFFAPETPSGIADSFGVDEGPLGQAVEQPNQVVPNIEDQFAVSQPTVAMEDQTPPEDYSQETEYGDNIQSSFGVENSSHDEHHEPTVPGGALNQMAWEQDGPFKHAPEKPLQVGQQDHMASRDTNPHVTWQQIDQTQTTPFSQPSDMLTDMEPSISMPEDSPDTSESDSSSSAHDTCSNSDQSQIETAAWREEEATSYDAYNHPPPQTYVPQPSPMDKMEENVPKGDIYEQKQSALVGHVVPSRNIMMINGKIIAEGPKEVAHQKFQPAPPPTKIGQPDKVDARIPSSDFFHHEQPAPPTDAVPPPLDVDKKEGNVPKSGSLMFFQTSPNMVQPPPVGKMEEDVTKTSAQTYFQPGPPPTNMVQPPPMTGNKTEENVPNTGAKKYFHPGPPPTDMVQSPPVGKMEKDVTKTSAQTYFQPGPPPTNMVQPPPMTGNKTEENVPNTGGQKYFHPGPPPTDMVQSPPVGKMEKDVTKTSAQTYFQPGPPPTNMVQPPPMTGNKTEENVPNTGGQKYFHPGPPPTDMVQSPPVGKMEKDVTKTSAQTYFQPGPPPTNMVQPPPMTGNKTEENVSNTGAQKYFHPGPPPTNMVQPPPMSVGKDVAKTCAQEYFKPGPPPTNMVQPPPITVNKMEENVQKYFQPGPPTHVVAAKMEDVSKTGGHEYFQPGPPPTSIGQPPPAIASKVEANIPKSQFLKYEQSAPPTHTIPQPSMGVGKKKELNQPPQRNIMPPSVADGLKKALHEHNQPAPPVSTAPPVTMFPKAAQMEHNARPAKTSTPEPPIPPESGPMALTKRPSREEKSRTPVSMSSSLWSTNIPAAMSPGFLLAPALQQSPKPAVPSPATSEALQLKQDMSYPQSLPLDQETKDESLPTLSKKERKAEKKRLKALKKEQKKMRQETVENLSTSTILPSSSTPEQVQPSLLNHPSISLKDSTSLSALPAGNTVHGFQEYGHHGLEREHHEKHSGDDFGVQHKDIGNPHVGDHGSPKESSVHHPSRETEYHGKCFGSDGRGVGNPHVEDHRTAKESVYHPHSKAEYLGKIVGSDGHEVGNPHRGEHKSRYREGHVEERRLSRHRDVEDEKQHYSNPRVRELREESPSRVSHEHLEHQDYSRRHGEHDPYREHYSASHALTTSHGDFEEKSFRGHDDYNDYRHNTSRDNDDYHRSHYGSEHDDRLDRDYRYTRDRGDAQGYRNIDFYDQYKKGQHRADDYDYYSPRKSLDHSYLDGSFDSQYDHRRPERSSRDELDSYRNDYYRDSADRGTFKPIGEPHYGEYKEPHRSITPSSGSGRSTPAGYNYSHDPYYGYQQQPHPYPGYEHHYGYYPGPYGMPYHYPPAPGYYPGYGPYYDYYQQYGGFGSGHGSQYSSGEGSYHDNQVNEGQQAEESVIEKDQEEGEVQEVVPLRTTPLHFSRPHMTCRFGPAGKLLVTLPHHPDDGQKPLVEIATLKAIFSIKEQEQIEAFPGPLSCRDTMKRQVIEYVQSKADEVQQSTTDLASQQARWVLWKFLLSLIKHNGAIVAEDIAEMLMMSVQHFEKKKKETKKKRHQSEESNSTDSSSGDDNSDDSSSDSSDDERSSEVDDASKPVDHLLVFRGLLLEGKTKEALEYAMKNGLWAHAVLLGGLMDTKVNNSMLDSKNSSSIISRFFMTLEENDPLKTVYEHLGGKVPHAIKHHTNWASNLAGIIANPTSFPEKDKENIITLGDTLAKHPDCLLASHLCYLLAGLRPGMPGTNSKMVLIGCEHRSKKYHKLESLEALQLTELFEYASSLENSEFYLPGLQMFRYFYATKLIDAGYHKKALDYLQCVGDLMIKHPHSFNETMKKNVYRTTEQLVGYMEQSGTNVESFVQSWLKKFNNVMEGKDSGISLPQDSETEEDEEDPMAQSSMSYFSGYEQPLTQEEKSSPESIPYTHNTVSRQASLQSTHSVPSVHSLQTLDLSQPMPSDIYQPHEPIEHKESFSSQGYQDQNDGPVGQAYETRQRTESFDTWQQPQQPQQHLGNDVWMPGVQQNNSWMPTASAGEIGRGTSPEDGQTTPVNDASFEDFYHQANPMMGRGVNWEDDSATTPTLAPSDSSLPSKDASESHVNKEKNDTKAADKNKSAQSSGFWTGITGLVKTLIPKGPKEVHLPDDKEKTIYFDKELNKWINKDESEEDRAPPPPPPTDAMIGGMSGHPSFGPPSLGPPSFGPRPGGNPMTGTPQGMMPSNPTMPAPGTMNTQAESVPDNSRGEHGSPGGPGSTGNNQQPLPGMPLPGMQTPGKPAGPPSKFSRKAQGRLGSRNKYVDVLNPNKGSQPSSQAVPSALFPVMPTGGSSFQGTFFVPSAAPADNDADNSLSQPPTDIQSGQDNQQPPSPTHSRSSSLGSQSTVSLASAEVRSYFEGQEQEGEQLQGTPTLQPTFFDPSNFQPQPQSPSMARRGRGRYPGGYNK